MNTIKKIFSNNGKPTIIDEPWYVSMLGAMAWLVFIILMLHLEELFG